MNHQMPHLSGGSMARAIWAVACLFFVILVVNVENGWGASGDNTAAGAASKISGAAPASPTPSPQSLTIIPKDNVPDSSGKPGDHYRMGPEDVIRVSVWENRELTLEVVVRPDGKISLPLIQDVQAEGLTASELAVIIRKQLESFIKDPQVAVILLQVNAPKIYVVGNVTRPGPYPLRGEATVLQALSLAGGFTQFASPRSIKLVRKAGSRQEVRKLNYYKLIDDEGEGNVTLKPGDTIVVP
jgi:polysaccharide export outer membrane protein